MADKDIKLVIKARNEASKAIDSVADALKDLNKAQKDTASSADKTGNLLNELGAEFGKLTKEAQGLAVLGKVAGEISKVEAAVERLEDDTKKAGEEIGKYADELNKATSATAKYEEEAKKVAAALDTEKQRTKDLRAERTAANRELSKAESAYEKLRAQLEKKPAGAAGKSALAFLAGDVDQAKGKLAEVNKAVDEQVKKQNDLKKTLSTVNSEVRKSGAEQSRLADQLERAGEAAKRSQANLDKAQSELKQIRSAASEAAAALGGVTFKQDELAAASARVAEASNRAEAELAAMKRFSDGAGGYTDPKTAETLRRQREEVDKSRTAWELLEAKVVRLSAAMASSAAPTQHQAEALRQATAAARAAKVEYDAQVAALNKLPGAAARASGGLRGLFAPIYGESRQAMSVLQRVRGEILSLATAYVGIYGTITNIGQVVKTFQAIEAAQNRLGVVFEQNSAAIRTEIGWIERQAARLGITFGVLSDSYTKFAVAASKSNFEHDATRKIFLAVAEAGRVNKLSMDDLRGVFVALEQMISKGKVSAEELRQQMGERLPGAFSIFAEALGVTTGELDAMLKKGEVFSDQATLLKFANQLNKTFGSQLQKSLSSTTTLMGRFSAEVEQAQMRVANGGFIEAFNRALEQTNKWFQSREGRDFFLSLGAALGRVVDIAAMVPQHLDLIGVGLKAIVAIKIAQWVVSLGKGFEYSNSKLAENIKLIDAAIPKTKVLEAAKNSLKSRYEALSSSVSAFATSIGTTSAAMVNGATWSRAYTATLTGFRTAVVAAAGAARTLYLAVGGWAGIAVTALSFLATSVITKWVSGVDDATTAMDEHKRITSEVIGAYESLKGKTKDWAKEVKNVTPIAAEKNFFAQFQAYNKALDGVRAAISKAEYGIRSDALKEGEALAAYIRTFDVKKIDEFQKGLRKLNDTFNDFETKKLVHELDSALDKAREQKQVLGEAAASADALGVKDKTLADVMRDLKPTMDSISEAAKGNDNAMKGAAEAVEKYKSALEEIKGMIPSVKKEMDKAAELAKLEENFNRVLEMGPPSPQDLKTYRDAKATINSKYMDTTPLVNSLDRNSDEIKAFYESIKGKANLMSSDPEKWGDPRDRTWRENNLATIETSNGKKAIVNKAAAAAFQGFISELESLGYEIGSVGGHALRGNTSNPNRLSEHAYGNSIDINPKQNPYGKNLVTDMPNDIGLLAAKYGLSWGGDWKSVKDAMHFEWTGQTPPGAVAATPEELELQKQKTAELVKQNEEHRKASEATDKLLADTQFEITQQDRIIEGKDREAFIEEKMRAARAQDQNMAPEKEAALRRELGLLYDKEHRLDGVKKAEEEVNRLYQLRKELMEQITFFEQQGNTEKVEQLKTQLEGVNEELIKAADNAINMHKALGGPDADLAIAKLENTKNQVKDLGEKSVFTAKGINEMLANGLVNAFDRFAQAVANGENAVQALWQAFRQFAADFLIEIGKMILKQALLNMLQGFGGGGGVGGAIAGAIGKLFHSGGIVGQAGGPSRTIAAGWFSNAVRYHEGGIAGLKPGEVPAILREQEVVDPGDGSVFQKVFGGQQQPPVIKIVNAVDAGDVISQGLNTPVGEQTLINAIRANSGAIKSLLT